MAALDPNIILGSKAPEVANPVDMAMKALTMKELANKSMLQDREIASQNAVRDAYRNNTQKNPDGSTGVNMKGVVDQVMQTNPQVGVDLQRQANANDLAQKQAQMKAQSDQLAFVHNSLGQVTDQASLDRHNAQMAAANIPNADSGPTVWNQAAKQKISDMYKITSDATQRNSDRDFGLKQQETSNKKRELDMEYYKTYGGAPPSAGAPAPNGPAPTAPLTQAPPQATPVAQAANPQGPQRVPNAVPAAPQPQAPMQVAPQAPAPIDPATLVRQYVPPAHQQKAFDEIEAAQNTSASAPKILAAFDQASKEVRPATGGTGISGTAFVPGMQSAGQKSMHALMGPTFKDVEGTVRQAAMDNMNENTTPQFGDNDSTVAAKRAALVGYLKSKSSAPVSKGFGIDLKKYPSTNYVPTVNVLNPKDGQVHAIPENQVKDAIAAGGQQI